MCATVERVHQSEISTADSKEAEDFAAGARKQEESRTADDENTSGGGLRDHGPSEAWATSTSEAWAASTICAGRLGGGCMHNRSFTSGARRSLSAMFSRGAAARALPAPTTALAATALAGW